ncbi:unnamed protein product [Aphanomyces euteiches]|uniref:Maltase n=1 Tax=Aphanomyces euteiches TaxID=100861 RepID=A0A6G0X7S9_9STRA|nr:hypothetical protein Ae201684_007595 [Aphanomyces euteiches]KAH9143763.1 hypothetical protein AeRB84_012258 [Aphanomyces euteiches]
MVVKPTTKSVAFWLALSSLVASVSAVEGDQCATIPSPRLDCYPLQTNFPNATKETCLAQGCCWDEHNEIPCAFGSTKAPSQASCDAVSLASRIACRNPRYFINPTEASACAALGCCFDGKECFQPSFPGYNLKESSWVETDYGYTGTLVLPSNVRGPFGNDIRELKIDVTAAASEQLRVRIFDPAFQRYEVPLKLNLPSNTSGSKSERLYSVSVTSSPFGLAITRKSTGEVLFNSTPGLFNGLIFENQFLELSTSVPSSPKVFGIGEHVGTFLVNATGDSYTVWARDQPADTFHVHTPRGGDNVYGFHPFYIRVEDSGLSHGLFLLTSNALEVVAQPHALTFRTLGGILDFFVFLGPSAPAVVQHYTALVGRPIMPPYWSLGYHICRWHYHSLSDVTSVVDRMRAAAIPQDSQWTDIDVMDKFLDFTWDPVAFPQDKFSAFIDDLHAHGQHYVPIVDAGISVLYPTYPAYVDGLAQNVFMKDGSNENLEENIVWPGMTAYTDFFQPNASGYWKRQFERYYETAKYDGIWLDMNEPSSFCIEGGRESLSCSFNDTYAPYQFVRSNDTAFPFDPFRQPFVPGQKVNGNLAAMTSSMAAHHAISLHYNVHPLYGHSEIKATRAALDSIRDTRSFILSRSTYAGDGQYTAHWLGDNAATWEDLHQSIAGVLAMNIFGIPMVGPDVCGFSLDTTKELCIRWHQAAILYPFFRNHNMADKDQAPVDFDTEAADIIRDVLLKRYYVLPYLYTQLYHAHISGLTVARSLYFEFPSADTIAIDSQYLLGSALLVSPAIQLNQRQVNAYLPANSSWYDLWTGVQVKASLLPRVTLDVPLNVVPVHIRGGSIVPMQLPNTTTTESRKNPFRLVVALPELVDGQDQVEASGDLYLDSGDSMYPVQTNQYTILEFSAKHTPNGYVKIEAQSPIQGYNGSQTKVSIEAIQVYGVRGYGSGSEVHVEYVKNENKRAGTGVYHVDNNTVIITDLLVEIGMPFTLEVYPIANHVTAPADGAESSTQSSPNSATTSSSTSPWLYVGIGSAVVIGGCIVYQVYQRRRGYTPVA